MKRNLTLGPSKPCSSRDESIFAGVFSSKTGRLRFQCDPHSDTSFTDDEAEFVACCSVKCELAANAYLPSPVFSPADFSRPQDVVVGELGCMPKVGSTLCKKRPSESPEAKPAGAVSPASSLRTAALEGVRNVHVTMLWW